MQEGIQVVEDVAGGDVNMGGSSENPNVAAQPGYPAVERVNRKRPRPRRDPFFDGWVLFDRNQVSGLRHAARCQDGASAEQSLDSVAHIRKRALPTGNLHVPISICLKNVSATSFDRAKV
jgi:hypothetical protein